MKIFLDNPESILKQLRTLYIELPVDIRTVKEKLSASELIFEAVEFITYLKTELGITSNIQTQNEKAACTLQEGPISKSKPSPAAKHRPAPPLPSPVISVANSIPIGTQIPVTVTIPSKDSVSKMNSLPSRPIVHSGPVQTFQRLIAPKPNQSFIIRSSDAQQSLSFQANKGQFIPLSGLRAPGNRFSTVITIPSSSIKQGTIAALPRTIGQSLLRKPITVMTKDWKGNPTPVTIIGTTSASSSALVKTVPVSIASPSTSTANTSAQPKIANFQSTAPVLSSVNNKQHLICPPYCSCPLSDDRIKIPELIREELMKKVCSWMKIKQRDSETTLTYNWIQESFLETLLSWCRRQVFFQFCRLISQDPDCSSNAGCVLLEQPRWCPGLKPGLMKLNGKLYCVPLLLVKFFRDSFGDVSINNLTVYSSQDCALTSTVSGKLSKLCLNPFHYVTGPMKDSISLSEHSYRVRANSSGIMIECVHCQDPTFNRVSRAAAIRVMPLSESIKRPIVVAPEQVIVKMEVLDDEGAFVQGNGSDEMPNTSNDDQESKISHELITPKVEVIEEEERERPLGSMDPSRDRSTSFVQPFFQCWKCTEKLDSMSALMSHACLSNLASSDQLYMCHLCGFCHHEVDLVRQDAGQCKLIGLSKLSLLDSHPNLQQIQEDMSSKSDPANWDGFPQGRSKRTKRVDSSSCKCEQCGISFATNTELLLHLEKIICKSIQCDLCKKFFANRRTHQNHACAVSNDNISSLDHLVLVVKGDHNLLLIKCQFCSKVMPNLQVLRHHLKVPVTCQVCQKVLANSCLIPSHSCQAHHTDPNSPQPCDSKQTVPLSPGHLSLLGNKRLMVQLKPLKLPAELQDSLDCENEPIVQKRPRRSK